MLMQFVHRDAMHLHTYEVQIQRIKIPHLVVGIGTALIGGGGGGIFMMAKVCKCRRGKLQVLCTYLVSSPEYPYIRT